MNKQSNGESKKLNGSAHVDEQVSKSEQGLLVDEVVSLHSIDSLSDEDAFQECQTGHPLVCVTPSKQLPKAYNGGVGRSLLSGQVMDLHDMADDIQALQEQVALLNKTKQDAPGETLLPEDSYSFLAVTKQDTSWRRPRLSFLVAFGIFAFQILTLVLLALDVVDKARDGNYLGIPGGVDIQVRISQLIAIIITVISQDEVRESLNVLYNGYDETIITREFGGASRARWYFSSICRLLEGLLALAVTFMLLITAKGVRELLLNFTAVQFVSNVDNAVFLLSKWGYFGKKMKQDAESVVAAEMDEVEKKRGRKFPRTACLILIFLGMLGVWLWISYEQMNGKYLPPSLYVQFGDELSATLGTFSGLYEKSDPKGRIFFGDRAEYVLASTTSTYRESARFRYCASGRKWVFLYGSDSDERPDVCTKRSNIDNSRGFVRAVSSDTFTYDLADTASDTWYFRAYDSRTDSSIDIPLQHFSLNIHKHVKGLEIKNGVWTCPNSRLGLNCQFPKPCATLEINERYDSFADSRSWSPRYDILNGEDEDSTTVAQVYGRPIYVGNETQKDTEQEDVRDLIFFTGRRWVLTHTNRFKEYRNATSRAKMVINDFRSGRFHAHWTKFSVVFVSEPVDVDTPTDGATPVARKWFRSKAQGGGSEGSNSIRQPDFNREEEAVLLCAICDEGSNPCVDNNECIEGRCECTNGSSGRLCQVTPEGDGRCNPSFNTAGYGYDGGDCCPQTCVRGEYTCGTGGNNASLWSILSPGKYIGFPECRDPNQQLCDEGFSCWKHLTDFSGSRGRNSKAGTGVKLSGNGAVAAMVESGLVRVFEQDGSTWKQRGEVLKAEVNFGSRIALSDMGSILAFAEDEQFRVFRWEPERKYWRELDEGPYTQGDVLAFASVSLSSNGTVLAISSVSFDSGSYSVSVFKYLPGEGWSQLGPTIVIDSLSTVSELPLSLSSDGSIVAVGYSVNGTVGVYRYSSTLGSWFSFGPPLSRGCDDTTYAVSLSGDGKSLAIGNPKYSVATVFVYNSSSSNWTQRGTDITGQTSSDLGASVALSDDAMVLVVGVPFSANDAENAHVKVYQYNASNSNPTWTQVGSDLSIATKDGSGRSVSISRDGNVLAFGAPLFGKDSVGRVRIMWNAKHQEAAEPDADSRVTISERAAIDSVDRVAITFEIQLDATPWDTSLTLDCNGSIIGAIPFDELMEPNKKVVGVLHLPERDSCTFKIADFYGDGICCSKSRNGFYKIYYGNEANETNLIAKGGQLFGSREQVTFSVEPPASLTPITVALALKVGSNAYGIGMLLSCGDVLQMRAPPGTFLKSHSLRSASFLLPKGTECAISLNDFSDRNGELDIYRENNTKAEANRLRHHGLSYGVPITFVVPGCEGCYLAEPVECDSGFSLVQFEFTADDYGGDINSSLWTNGGLLIDEGYLAYFPSIALVKHYCVPDDECLHFKVYNETYSENRDSNETCCEGGETNFRLLMDGKVVLNGSSVREEYHTFGDCPPTPSPTVFDVCPPGEKMARVEIFTDWYPQDTIWGVWEVHHADFDEQSTTSLLGGGPYRPASQSERRIYISNSTCVQEDVCLRFGIRDLSGNGLCCKYGPGMYTVYYDGDLIATGREFGSYEVTPTFGGNCLSLPSPSPTQGGTEPLPSLSLMPSETLEPSFSVAPTPTMFEIALGLISPRPTPEPVPCSNGTTSFRFEITMDRNPQDVSWTASTVIGEARSIEPFIIETKYDEYADAFQSYAYDLCFPDNQCIQFTFRDASGDGVCCEFGNGNYSLYYNDTLIDSGGEEFAVVEKWFGSCDLTATPSLSPHTSPSPGCTDGFALLHIELFTDLYPAETFFVVTDDKDGSSWINGGPYDAESNVFELFVYDSCLPIDRCFTFEICDTYGDGMCCDHGEGYYSLSFGGERIKENTKGDFDFGQPVQFGTTCDSDEYVESSCPNGGTSVPSWSYSSSPSWVPTPSLIPSVA